MRVKCPQCGREFEIPDSQANRMLRCMCKNLFRGSPIKSDAPKKEVADLSQVATPHIPAPGFEEESAEPSSSFSDTQINSFLSNLKATREEIHQQEKTAEDLLPKIPVQREIELAVDPSEDETKILPELPEEILQPPPVEGIDENRISQTETARSSFAQKKAIQKRKMIFAVCASSVFAISILIYVLFGEKKTEQKPDPYLSKLLQPSENRPAPETSASKKEKSADKISEKPASAPAKKSIAIVTPTEEEEEVEPPRKEILAKLLRSTYDGDFENVIRIATSSGDLRTDERALYLEALFDRAGKDKQRYNEIKMQLAKAMQGSSDAVYSRTQAVALLRGEGSNPELFKALEILKSLSITRQRDALVYAYLGLAYEKLEQPNLAHRTWDQALTLQPNFPWVIRHREQLYRATKDYKNAFEMAKRLSRLSGEEQTGAIKMAELSGLQKNKIEAIKYYQQSLRIKESAKAHLNLGLLLLESDQPQAQKEFELGLRFESSGATKRDLYFNLGKIYCENRMYRKGIAVFQKALKEDRNYSPIYLEKGICESKLGLYPQATESLESALKKNTKNSDVWLEYGMVLMKAKKQRAALGAINRSIELKPTDKAHFQMALLLMQLNRRQEAVVHAKKAYKLNPKNKAAKALVAKLE